MQKHRSFSRFPALVTLSLLNIFVAGPSMGEDLRSDQAQLIEKLMADIEPEMRAMLRPQIEQSVISMSPFEIKMVQKQFDQQYEPGLGDLYEASDQEASEEDLAYNRAQYEPFMREIWQSRKAFDAHVIAELKKACPGRDEYASFISAARFELPALTHRPTTSDSVEQELLFASGYAPRDRRYSFDFSGMRVGFDKRKVSAIVTKACADWKVQAADFKREVDELVNTKKTDLVHDLQHTRSVQLAETVVRPFEESLRYEAPSGNDELMLVIMSPKPSL